MKHLPTLFALVFTLPLSGQGDSLRTLFEDTNSPDSVRFERGIDLMITQFRSDLDNARSIGEELLAFALDRQSQQWEATAHRLIGNTYAIQSNYGMAHEHFFKSHDILLELGNKKGLTVTTNNIGNVYYELGDYIRAQEYMLRSLGMAESLNDTIGASRALNNLGNVHYDQRNNAEALDYYTRSLRLKEELGQRSKLPQAYNNIGLVHANLNEHDKALEALSKSAESAKELGDPRSESRAYSNIGIQHSQAGNFDLALDFFNRSIAIKTEINDVDGLTSAFLYRGKNHLSRSEFRRAQEDCMKSLTGSERSGAVNIQKESCQCLSDVHETLGDHRAALKYQKRFQLLKDSLFNKERTQEITRAEMNYAFEKEQLADSIAFHKLQTEQQVAHERQLNTQHRRFFITLLISLLIIAGLGFLYWKHKQDLKVQVLENQVLNSEIEYKKKDLTTMAVNISNNQEWAESLVERLGTLKASTGRKRAQELEELETQIKNKIWVNKDSDEFYTRIDELSSAFYDRLTTQFEGLTKTEIRLCSLIKLDLNTKQIAALQNINPSSVKMSRNRLRKKLDLAPEDDLNAFLRSF